MDRCFIMLCNKTTEQICLKENLFASGSMHWIENIQRGDLGFLLNLDADKLLGVFQADTIPSENLVSPNPFGENKFTFQFKVKRISKELIEKNASSAFRDAKIRVGVRDIPAGGTVHTGERAIRLLSHFEINLDDIKKEEKDQNLRFSIPMQKDASAFRNVIGLDDAKDFIMKRMVNPLEDIDIANEYALRLGGGLLLYGPPGTGKTRLAEAVAREINAEYREISPSIIHGYPGDAERNIEQLFLSLRHDIPRAVLFFDEAEGIFCPRESNQSTVMQRVIPVLLSQFTKLASLHKPILIIGATNQPGKVDPAFLRPGRFDKIFFVDLPNELERKNLLQFFLNKRKNKVDREEINDALQELAKKLKGYSGADIEQISYEAAQLAYDDKKRKICRADIEESILQTPKSVTSKDIKKLIDWGRSRGNKVISEHYAE